MATYAGTGALFEIRSGATAGNLGGGGFNIANANFISNWSATSANTASPVLSSVTYAFVAGDVNAWVYVKSGTNWTPGFYQIASVAGGNATLSAAIGAAVQLSNGRWITNTVAGCATVASPTSGNGGIDYSQQNAAQFTATTLTGATTTFTDATNPVAANWVGNLICMKTGTGLTAGWYEIVSQSAGTATIDRSAGATYSSVTYYLGGAISLGGSTSGITDAIALALGSTAATSGCRFFLKGPATYAVASAITSTTSGNANYSTIFEGYTSIRGDRPSIASGNQPILSMGATVFTASDNTQLFNITGLGTASSVFLGGTSAGGVLHVNCKAINSSTSTTRVAFNGVNFPNNQYIGCEGVSYNGTAISLDLNCIAAGCYAHDSSIGIDMTGATNCVAVNNIVATCSTEAINSNASGNFIWGNTLYGAENKFGIGINSATKYGIHMNNILYGFVSGFGGSVTQLTGISDYNCFNNNTANIAAGQSSTFSGASDVTGNPSFTSVAQVTGTTATSSGTTLTDSGKNFTTAGVVAGRDYLRVKSGTGATVATYGITVVGTTTLTTDNTIGTSSGGDLVYQITTGRNFAPTSAVKATGYPASFPAALTTGYTDIGAVQIIIPNYNIFDSAVLGGG